LINAICKFFKIKHTISDTKESIEPIEPIKSIEPIEPIESIEPIEPIEPIEHLNEQTLYINCSSVGENTQKSYLIKKNAKWIISNTYISTDYSILCAIFYEKTGSKYLFLDA